MECHTYINILWIGQYNGELYLNSQPIVLQVWNPVLFFGMWSLYSGGIFFLTLARFCFSFK